MSKTTTVRRADRMFWALDDAFGAWFAYLAEEAERQAQEEDRWASDLSAHWRVAAAVTDYGATVPTLKPHQVARLLVMARGARDRAESHGTVSVDELQRWTIVDDLPVAGAFSRTGNAVEVDRILEVGDAFIAPLDGSLPPEPADGLWLVGMGDGYRVMPMRNAVPPDPPSGSGAL